MSCQDLVRDALLAAAVAFDLLCCLGALRASTAYDRLHYVVPATTLVPLLVVAAIVLQEGTSTSMVKAVLIGLGLVALSPVISHATARAVRIREFGQWIVMPEERHR
jgi:multisubunit Na+/H+ antiporter MnhG subunit